jgi:hypothetical protein
VLLDLFALQALLSAQRSIQRKSGRRERYGLAQRIVSVREGEGTRVSPRVLDYPLRPVEQDEGHAVFCGLPVELKFKVFAVADSGPPSGTQITQKSACAAITFEEGVSGFKAMGHSRMQEPRFGLFFRGIGERVEQPPQRRVLAGLVGACGAAIRARGLTRLLALADKTAPQIKPAMTITTAKRERVRFNNGGKFGATLSAVMVLLGWRELAHDAPPRQERDAHSPPVFRTIGEQIFKRFSNGW